MKFFATLLIQLFPKEWIKPVFAIVLAFGAFKGIDFYLIYSAKDAVRFAYNEAHASTIKRVEDIETRNKYADNHLSDIKSKVDSQGSKLDRIDGKTDTIIQLLKR